jgi:cytochrome c-type biogenesis protein CcmH
MKTLLAMLALLIGAHALAIDTAPAFEDPEQQQRYERIIRELRCVQCRAETIADSNVSLAADLRRQVRELMAAGRTDEEIFTYMTDRYGDYVLFKPRMSPRTILLWAAPILLLLAGGAAAAIVIVRKSRLPDTDPADPGLGAS